MGVEEITYLMQAAGQREAERKARRLLKRAGLADARVWETRKRSNGWLVIVRWRRCDCGCDRILDLEYRPPLVLMASSIHACPERRIDPSHWWPNGRCHHHPED